MSDAESQLQAEETMRSMAAAIQEILDETAPNLGFALIVFEFNCPEGLSNYISNAERGSMIQALKETVISLESKKDIPAVLHGSVQ